MREVSIKLRCDWDGCEQRAVEGTDDLTVEPIELVWDGETKTVDLCGDHAQFLADTLIPLMQRGRAPEGKKPKSKKPKSDKPLLTCRICGKQSSKVGLVQHVLRGHGYTSWEDYINEFELDE